MMTASGEIFYLYKGFEIYLSKYAPGLWNWNVYLIYSLDSLAGNTQCDGNLYQDCVDEAKRFIDNYVDTQKVAI